jgi:hypothetical protein
MRVVAAPHDENNIMTEERARLSTWAPSNGRSYVEYGDVFDLLARLAELQLAGIQQVSEIEIVAHGNPALCNDVSLENAAIIGESLRRIAGVSDRTAVYLSGCNTGLELNGECIAHSFARSFKAAVFGSRGYLAGTHAEGNERCVAAFKLDGIVYHSYPGGADAVRDDVWNSFGPSSGPGGGKHMQIKVATSGFRTINVTDAEVQDLAATIEALLRTPSAESARKRIAPVLTFALKLSDGEHVFELLAAGTVLRDPVTKRVWQFDRGREVLRSLLPYRKLPAA